MKTEVRDRLTLLSTSTYITTAMIARWLNMAKDYCLDYKKWPFLEYRGSDLIDATGEYPYPTKMKTTSVFLITVGGERFVKIRYEDYLKYLEDNSGGDSKVWAEFDRTVYINGNACSVGDTVYFYGQKIEDDMSADGDTTPFDDAEKTGDEAVIERALYLALKKIPNMHSEAMVAKQEAKDLLDEVWDRIEEARPRTVVKGTPLLQKIDILKGTTKKGGIDNIGNF